MTTNKRKTGLLDLPAEITQNIWEYVGLEKEIICCRCIDGHPHGPTTTVPDCNIGRYFPGGAKLDKCCEVPKFVPASAVLMQVNRQIAAELREYNPVTFVFCSHDCLFRCYYKLSKEDRKYLKLARHSGGKAYHWLEECRPDKYGWFRQYKKVINPKDGGKVEMRAWWGKLGGHLYRFRELEEREGMRNLKKKWVGLQGLSAVPTPRTDSIFGDGSRLRKLLAEKIG